MDTDFESLPPLNLQSPAFGASDWSYTETLYSTESSHKPEASGGGGMAGAFYTQYTDEDGHTFLQGGGVSGGNGGSASIADEKVIDEATGPVHAEGVVLYLKASCKATVEDGVMLPGCEVLGTPILTTTGGSNHTFTTDADTGYLYYEIGRWTTTAFLPSGAGNLSVSGCIGDFNFSRI